MRRLIFIVDDDPQIRRSLQRALSGARWETEVFASPVEALERVTHRQPNVVLSDYSMPGMTGLELLTRISADYPDVGRILVSSHADEQDCQDAVRDGRIHIALTKPFSVDDLLAALHSFPFPEHSR